MFLSDIIKKIHMLLAKVLIYKVGNLEKTRILLLAPTCLSVNKYNQDNR